MSDAVSQAYKEILEEKQQKVASKTEDVTQMLKRVASEDAQFEIDNLVSANSALVGKNEELRLQVHKMQAVNLQLRKQMLEMKSEYSNLQSANIALEKQLWDVEFAQNADWLISEGHFKFEKMEGK